MMIHSGSGVSKENLNIAIFSGLMARSPQKRIIVQKPNPNRWEMDPAGCQALASQWN